MTVVVGITKKKMKNDVPKSSKSELEFGSINWPVMKEFGST